MKNKILGIFVCMLLIVAAVIPVAGILGAGNIKTRSNSSLMSMRFDTYVNEISPYNIHYSPLTITATGPSDLDSVTLYYRRSSDNQSWGNEAITYETGIIENVNGWTMVNLDNNYTNPIVIVTGQEGADISLDVEKSRPRIRNINSNNFEVIVTNDLGTTITEDVGYIVMEKGHWVIDGVEVEAGTYNVSSISPQDITFIETFPGDTIVVDTIQEESPIGSSRYTEGSMSSTGFSVYWVEYDVYNNNIGPVTAGYIAVEDGSSSNIFESGIQQEVDDDPDSGTWSSVTFSNDYSSTPILFTNPLDDYGPDPCIVGRSNLNPSGFNMRVTEGQNEDNELTHVACDIPWIVWTEITVNIKNWAEWDDTSNPDTSYPWSWNFNFPNGTGYYEFYSIGKKTGEDDETAPLVADARCRFNRMPEIFDENPINGSTSVELTPQLNISISDADGDTMTINWYSNSSGSWQAFGSNINIGNGTYSQTNSNFNNFETTYWWYVTVTDNIYTISSPIFHFTTEENLPPNTPSNPVPEDGEIDVYINEIFRWTGGDPNSGDKLTYYVYFGTNSPPPLVDEVTPPRYDPGTLDLNTMYYWQIVAEDSGGLTSTGPIWSFTTEKEPNEPPTAPDIYGPHRGPAGVVLCWAFVSDDPNEHQIKYIIEWGDEKSTETEYSNIAVEACHTFEEQGEYKIKAKAIDIHGAESAWTTIDVNLPKNKPFISNFPLLNWLFERFPNAFQILRQLLLI